MLKKMLNAIIDKGNKNDMEELGDIFIDMLQDLKNTNKEWYNCIKYKMYCMAYGEHLNEHLATKWVENMDNKDGSEGEHWSYEQTEQVRKQYAPDLDHCDFYAVLNMAYSDFYNEKFTTEDYIKIAKDFINDKDAPKGKILKYYFFIVD